jgi:hypothetical protein
MTRLLFIHGTGVRQESYDQTFELIGNELAKRGINLALERCFWGGEHGASLHHDGASIPNYDSTRDPETATDEEQMLALWDALYRDPLYELRALALQAGEGAAFVPGQQPPGEKLRARVPLFTPSAALQARWRAAGLGDTFNTARDQIAGSAAFHDALASAGDSLGPYYDATARAIVAAAIAPLASRNAPVPTADQRDDLALALADELSKGEADRGIPGWVSKQVLGIAFKLGAFGLIERKRGAITDAAYPAAADIILYQAHGEAIRSFIRERISAVAAADPDVIVLAHSLGGIAAVDLLALEDIPHVKLLVTAGTQAPLLYEIGALCSLSYDTPLPDHFPPWVNIYDPHDFLSYVGKKLFGEDMDDVEIDSRQPFPYAHGAYWTNDKTWEAIKQRLA